MKRILKSALLITLLTNLLTAETVFDLSQQHFSNSLDGSGEGARYNLPKVYVSTALKYVNGSYTLSGTTAQTMNIENKTPLSNWSVSFDITYIIDRDVVHPIRFTSDTGETITVSFRWNAIHLNGAKIYNHSTRFTPYLEGEVSISGAISKYGNTVTCKIAGYVTKVITVNNFSKLKFVNVSLHKTLTSLHGLNIGSSD